MRNILRHIADLPYRLMAMASVATIIATDAHAQGGQGIGWVANTLQGNFQQLGNLTVAGGFLGGVGLSGSGLLKLKAAADDGGQRVKYSEGLWRMGVGGCLCALPAVTGVGTSTFFGTASGGNSTMGSMNFQ
jgi:hypothetical protein